MILILLYELYEITTIENQSGKNLSLQIDHRQSPIKNFFLRKQVLLISASAEKPRTLARLFLKHFLKPWFQLHCTTFISRHAVNTKISNADVWFSVFFLKSSVKCSKSDLTTVSSTMEFVCRKYFSLDWANKWRAIHSF